MTLGASYGLRPPPQGLPRGPVGLTSTINANCTGGALNPVPLDAAPSYGTFSNASIAFEPSTANSLATMVLEVAPTSSLEPGDALHVWVPGFSFTAPLGGSLDDVAFASSSSASLRVQYVEGSFGSVQVGALKVADEGYLRRDSDAPETPAGLESMREKVNEALASSQLYEETPPQILDVRAALYAAPGGGDDQSALRGTSICAGELIPIFVPSTKMSVCMRRRERRRPTPWS